ncbi:unnamed protein product [Rotaria socialis]|uniref:Uncharacterized protein n=1 Tax=Rotaria socialis TaxID=392032 RepID=A0A821N6P9_9BILA|nr:unnamed protein product [Rotaria socialis]
MSETSERKEEVQDQDTGTDFIEEITSQTFERFTKSRNEEFNINQSEQFVTGHPDLERNMFARGWYREPPARFNRDNLETRSVKEDTFHCDKIDYISLVNDRERLHQLLAKIDSGQLIHVTDDTNKQNNKKTSTEVPVTMQNNAPMVTQSQSSNVSEPSVRSKTNIINVTETSYAAVCRNNAMPTYQSNNSNVNLNQTYSHIPHLNSNPFQGSNQYSQSYSNSSMPQFMNAPQQAMPQYIINQSRIINPPELPTFRSNTLDHFNSYLLYFESYCVENYGTARDRWNSLLINKMTKEVKSTLPPEAEFEWPFDKVVSHIQDYLKLAGSKEDISKVGIFLKMKKEPNDNVTVFSVKLLQAFKAAYPHEEFTYSTNTTLIERYLYPLPDDTQHFIQDHTAVHKSMGQTLLYETYVKLAEKFEKEIKPRQQQLNKLGYNNSTNPISKYYPPQFKNQNVQHNKIASEMQINSDVEREQNWVQDFGHINISVPPPNYNPFLPELFLALSERSMIH